jgi:hypothetical protein
LDREGRQLTYLDAGNAKHAVIIGGCFTTTGKWIVHRINIMAAGKKQTQRGLSGMKTEFE